jgi:hypothetical protein
MPHAKQAPTLRRKARWLRQALLVGPQRGETDPYEAADRRTNVGASGGAGSRSRLRRRSNENLGRVWTQLDLHLFARLFARTDFPVFGRRALV